MAKDAFGTLLQISTSQSSSAGFITLGEVRNLKGPELGRKTNEVTSHDSPSGAEEHLPGIRTGGTVSGTVNYTPSTTTTGTTGILAARYFQESIKTGLPPTNTTQKEFFKLLFSVDTANPWTFSGIPTKFAPDAPADGALTADFEIKTTGLIGVA